MTDINTPKFPSNGSLELPRNPTSQDFLNIANIAGMGPQADAILARKGEDIEKIFSGGPIQDLFDGLNALQYGVVGMMKGKSFLEGVRTRQSFSDQDAMGKFGIPGMIIGIGADIAVDPLTYLTPWTIFKKFPGAVKALKSAGKFGKSTKIGNRLGKMFVYRFGQDPVWAEMAEKSIRNIQLDHAKIIDTASPLFKMDPMVSKAMLKRADDGSLIRRSIEEVSQLGLNERQMEAATELFTRMDNVGDELVNLKVLKTNKDDYIANLYTTFEEEGFSNGFFGRSKKAARSAREKARKLVTDNPAKLAELGTARKALGEIDEAVYPLTKGLLQATQDLTNARLYDDVSKLPALFSKEAIDGFKQLPGELGKSGKFGALNGGHVPEFLFDDLMEMTKVSEKGIPEKLWAGFKFGKVLLNPATHARNMMSNATLNWWKLGMNPLDPRVGLAYAESAKEIASKGGKWLTEAKTVGYGLDTFAFNEIKTLLNMDEAKKAFGGTRGLLKRTAGKIADLYQGEENFAKLSAFIFNRKHKGLGIEAAWTAAESATFNYAQVTPFIRKLRESIFGMPFITFSAKATPLVGETLLKAPRRISAIGKIKQGIEAQSDIKETKRERASEPQWVRDGLYVKMPMKDSRGRSAYLDLSYVIPFGDMASGQILQRQVERETGLRESVPEAVASKFPVFNLMNELGKNQDFYGNKIWRDSDSTDKQLADMARHIAKSYLPPLVGELIPGGIQTKGRRAGKRRETALARVLGAPSTSQQRTGLQEALRLMGLKVQPVSVDTQEQYAEWERKNALQTLLGESAIIRESTRTFIPKK